MKIASLYIYPLKGGSAVEVAEAEVTPKGLLYDRVLMAVEPATQAFVTQRENPKLATVRALPDHNGVTLSAPGQGGVYMTWEELQKGPRAQTKLWDDAVETAEGPAMASAWLSQILGQNVILTFQPQDARRETSQKYAPGGEVSFADGYPVLVAFTASLDDLNARIAGTGGAPVPMGRFRPNIVVENAVAWQEDAIGRLRLGSIEMSLVKPCTRCIVTTIDQGAGVKAGAEPLKTLATFRFSPERKGVLFAENAVPHGTGLIRTGDAVEALSAKPAPAFKQRTPK